MKKIKSNYLLILISLFFFGCTNSEFIYYQRARQLSSSQDYLEALKLYDKVIQKSIDSAVGLKAAREAAKICFFQIKDYKKSINYYKLLVVYSDDSKERLDSQKQIASIYFDHLNQYPESVIEYSKLLQMNEGFLNEFEYRTKIAKSYFFQNNFAQALSEADELLQKKPKDEYEFPLLLLKANILTSSKKMDEAIKILELLLARHPKLATQENIHLVLSLAYEEKKEFNNAIEILEKFKEETKDKEFVIIRIERLKQRLLNAPGSKGLRK